MGDVAVITQLLLARPKFPGWFELLLRAPGEIHPIYPLSYHFPPPWSPRGWGDMARSCQDMQVPTCLQASLWRDAQSEAVMLVGRAVPSERASQPKRLKKQQMPQSIWPDSWPELLTDTGLTSQECLGPTLKGVKFLCQNVGPGASEFGYGDNKTLENMEISAFLHISKSLTHCWRSGKDVYQIFLLQNHQSPCRLKLLLLWRDWQHPRARWQTWRRSSLLKATRRVQYII